MPITGTFVGTHDLDDGFLANQLSFGAAVTLAGNGVTLTNDNGLLPVE